MKTCLNFLLTRLIIILVISAIPTGAYSQILGVHDQKEFTDSMKRELDFGPFFGLYKDNYFTVGTALGQTPNKVNSDVKFQISFGIRLTNAILPWHTYLFLMYTQKTFWNVFENSMPMRDLNFNPGIGWAKPFFSKGRYLGKMTLMLEHESNGRDSIQSRSWNKVSLGGSAMITDWMLVHAKFWIPIVDGENNRDILRYSGIWQTGCQVYTFNKKFCWALTLIKRKGWNFNFNTILDFSWEVNDKANLWFFAQYYNGFGENMLDYNKFHSRIRAGIAFRPKFFSEF